MLATRKSGPYCRKMPLRPRTRRRQAVTLRSRNRQTSGACDWPRLPEFWRIRLRQQSREAMTLLFLIAATSGLATATEPTRPNTDSVDSSARRGLDLLLNKAYLPAEFD